MAPALDNLGVATPVHPSPAPSPSDGNATGASPSPAWPRSAQYAAALLLILALGLIAGHLFTMSRAATRPTESVRSLDLNCADLAELRQLPGIGDTLAQRIAEHRRTKGRFSKIDDLRQVKGIGPATLETLRPFVHVDQPTIEEVDEVDSSDAPAVVKEGVKQNRGEIVRVVARKPIVGARIDLNRASIEELRKLPGIGPKLSERIIDSRSNRPFDSIDDFRRRVPGIGPKTLERLRPLITVASPSEKAALAQ